MRKEFQVGHKVLLAKSHLKRLLSKWKLRGLSPFIVNKVFADGMVEIYGLEYLHTFMVKFNRLKIYVENEMLVEKVSLTTAWP